MHDVAELAQLLTVCSEDERVVLLAAIRQKEIHLRVLNDFAGSLIGISAIEDLAWYVAKEVVGRLGFVDCVLYELDTERQVLVQRAAIGEKNPKARTIVNVLEIAVGTGITGQVAQRRRPEIVDDLQNDSRYVRDLNVARSEICVPLMHGEALLGVIDCEDPRPNHFTDDHLETLTVVAALTSSKMATLRAAKKIQDQAQMLENVREAITVTDLDGIILECNEGASTIYGYPRQKMIGHNVAEFYPSHDKWMVDRDDQLRHLEQFGSWRGNMDVIRKDGEILTMDISLTPLLDNDGAHVTTIAVARDITQLVASEKAVWEKNQALVAKQMELKQALAEGATARRANLAKDAFLANISHELRTPLTGVIGMIDLLNDTALDKEQKNLATTAKTSARALLAIIDDVLDLAKIGAGKIRLREKPFEPVETVRDITEALRPSAEQKGLTFDVITPSPQPYALMGDANRIRQILFNLIGNAIKFTDSGSITISLTLDMADQDCGLSVSVTDTGVGFTKDEAALLFERFEQLDTSATKNASGTGLGLAISSELAGLMAGSLSATGHPGVGASFVFAADFETVELADDTKPLSAVEANNAAPLELMLAEDNPVNQMLISKLLERFPWKLTIVANGQEALDLLASGQRFDGILMDIRMPVLDGLQATTAIRMSKEAYASIPILALTANTMEADRKQYEKAGMNAIVGKPIDLNHLLMAVETHIKPQVPC